MDIFGRCDMCVGECKHCAEARIPYNVGFLAGEAEAKEEMLKRIDNCRFGNRGGLVHWADILKCLEVEDDN